MISETVSKYHALKAYGVMEANPYLDVIDHIHVPFKYTPGYRFCGMFAGPFVTPVGIILGTHVLLYIRREIPLCAPVLEAHQNLGFGFAAHTCD
jgi:hypothetical protein